MDGNIQISLKSHTFPLIFSRSGFINIQSNRILITGKYASSLSLSKSSNNLAASFINSTSSITQSCRIPFEVDLIWSLELCTFSCLLSNMPALDKLESFLRAWFVMIPLGGCFWTLLLMQATSKSFSSSESSSNAESLSSDVSSLKSLSSSPVIKYSPINHILTTWQKFEHDMTKALMNYFGDQSYHNKKISRLSFQCINNNMLKSVHLDLVNGYWSILNCLFYWLNWYVIYVS